MYTHTQTYIYMHMHKNICTSTRMYCTHTHIYICMHVTHIYVDIHTYTHVGNTLHICMYINISIHVCTHIYIHMHICAVTHISYTHMHTCLPSNFASAKISKIVWNEGFCKIVKNNDISNKFRAHNNQASHLYTSPLHILCHSRSTW